MAEKKDSSKKSDSEIPGMNLDTKYTAKKPVVPEGTEKLQKELEKTKKDLEKIKGSILKKYKFIQAIGILPSQAIKFFVEDELGENIPEEEYKKLQKKVHLYIILPEDKYKEIPKIKKQIVEIVDKSKQDVWIYLKTPVDIWEACMDSKFDLVNFIGMSYPLHDTGILSALRVAEIHKNLVLQKFDKYVVSYVIGGSLVRGDVTKESDVDSFVIINDTDVKRMPRLELKERLRGMIYQFVAEATALAGVKRNMLNVQIYLLTDFWESVKDAHPVMFTFIRDGVPLYDKGTFLPWKALLKMGRLKPSPEAIEMFMSMGDKTIKRAKKALMDIFAQDIFWGVTTPAQAIVMLNGSPPPNAKKELVKEFKKSFLKNKMIEKKYVDFLEKVVNIWRDYEHEKIKEISGKEIDDMLEKTEDFIKRLKELRKEIEKRFQEKTIEQIYDDVFNLLKAVTEEKSQKAIVDEFEKLVKKGKFTQQHIRILKDIINAKTQHKKGKLDSHKVHEARKNASILINELVDYTQRAELATLEKSRMRIRYMENNKPQIAELLNTNDASFLIRGKKIQKITNEIQESSAEEMSKHIEAQKSAKMLNINREIFDLVKKELGEFEMVI